MGISDNISTKIVKHHNQKRVKLINKYITGNDIFPLYDDIFFLQEKREAKPYARKKIKNSTDNISENKETKTHHHS